MYIYIYIYLKTPFNEQDATQSQDFLSRVKQVCILSFPSLRSVVISMLKGQTALLFIYSYITLNEKTSTWIFAAGGQREISAGSSELGDLS